MSCWAARLRVCVVGALVGAAIGVAGTPSSQAALSVGFSHFLQDAYAVYAETRDAYRRSYGRYLSARLWADAAASLMADVGLTQLANADLGLMSEATPGWCGGWQGSGDLPMLAAQPSLAVRSSARAFYGRGHGHHPPGGGVGHAHAAAPAHDTATVAGAFLAHAPLSAMVGSEVAQQITARIQADAAHLTATGTPAWLTQVARVWVHDASEGTWTDLTEAAWSEAAGDVQLLPAAPDVDDAVYFGSVAPLDAIRIDNSVAGTFDGDVVWELDGGGGWWAFDVRGAEGALRDTGVHIGYPSGIGDGRTKGPKSSFPAFTGHWVRLRVLTAGAGTVAVTDSVRLHRPTTQEAAAVIRARLRYDAVPWPPAAADRCVEEWWEESDLVADIHGHYRQRRDALGKDHNEAVLAYAPYRAAAAGLAAGLGEYLAHRSCSNFLLPDLPVDLSGHGGAP